MQRSFLFLAEGFEEIEALAVVDVIRRSGMTIHTVSITNNKEVTGSHGITVKADLTLGEADFSDSEWLICPGGMPGSVNLYNCKPLCDLIKNHKGKVAAICAAPAVVLAPLGILEGKEATCYPGFEEELRKNGATVKDERVVVAGNVITANGPFSALRFGLAIVANSLGTDKAREVGEGMLLYHKGIEFYF